MAQYQILVGKLLGPSGTGPKQTLEVKTAVTTSPRSRRTAAHRRLHSVWHSAARPCAQCVRTGAATCAQCARRRLAPTNFTRKLALQLLAVVVLLIRSTTGITTPSSVCTRKRDEFITDEISSSRWLEQVQPRRQRTAAGGVDERRPNRTFILPHPMLNKFSSVSVRESLNQYLCDPQWFRDTASRGPTTCVTPKTHFRTNPSDHAKAPSNIAP
ncbi:putative serine/threonine-protein kinase Cx32, chloroplastic-like [Dorcoceras hygrometricum]|uniref:Putative serine/threonine-protein kinase Cx32, chloroplastic-like n=1 Tax=Dorcoceras hygrometricum TaxID=472368 RepID=A0A2Z7DJ89_9LAMI|nr:putative serine/threonine-protein kinase Cx32, chloroplastic-like [Dorcoceras hygrometricum]